jgi:hypothetical protein
MQVSPILSFLKLKGNEPFYYVSAMLFLSLIYLLFRYYQAALSDEEFRRIPKDFKYAQAEYLSSKGIVVYDYRNSYNPHVILPYSGMLRKYVINFNHRDYKLAICASAPDSIPFKGLMFWYHRFRLFVRSLISLMKFIANKTIVLEYVFPFILAVVAILELMGLHVGKSVIASIAFLLEKVDHAV